VFGAYCDLVFAIEADRRDLVKALLAEIAAAPNRPADLAICDLADPTCDPIAERYVRLINTDPSAFFNVLPPTAEIAAACRERISAAFRLLDAGDPALAAEIRALIGEIVLAIGSEDPTAMQFDGASSFMLWGAIVLNATAHRTDLETAQALTHESGHNLLFGLSADGPLVESDDKARYPSPLRADPRPMDGIVHATYVTARMHRAVAQLLNAGVVNRAEAEASLATHRRAFDQGWAIIARDGRLSERGRAAMAGACAYMRGFAERDMHGAQG
jgi:HEXXH motif-containing protein